MTEVKYANIYRRKDGTVFTGSICRDRKAADEWARIVNYRRVAIVRVIPKDRKASGVWA